METPIKNLLLILSLFSIETWAGLTLVGSLEEDSTLREVTEALPSSAEFTQELDALVHSPLNCFQYTNPDGDNIIYTDCAQFLDKMQAGIVTGLSEKIQILEAETECLNDSESELCNLVTQHDSSQLQQFQSYRHNLYQHGITYNGSDFESVAQVNGGERAVLRRRVSPMTSSEQEDVWKAFDEFQREYISQWWSSPQMSSRFPNRDICIEEGISNLTPFRQKMLIPTFRNRFGREERQYKQECEELRRYYYQHDYTVPMMYAYHRELRPKIEQNLDGVEPWFHLLSKSPVDLNQQQKNEEIKKAKQDLINDYKKILEWANSLEDDEKDKLLGFSDLASQMGAPQICDNYSKFGWNDVYNFIPEMITPINIFKNIFIDNPFNDRAFLAGFMDQEGYEARRADIASEQAALIFYSPAQAGIQSSLLSGAKNGLSLLARKYGPQSQRLLNQTRNQAVDYLSRLGIQRRFNGDAPSTPRVNALQEFMQRTGRKVEIRRTINNGDVIFDTETGEALFAFKYKLRSRNGTAYFHDITVEAAGHRAANKGHGFFSMFFNRMVTQNPNVNSVHADLWYDNLQRVNQLVRQGYTPLEAIKGTPSYRVYLQNGFSEINESSLRISRASDGSIGRITFTVNKP